jgi:hypothetical protein
MEDTDKPSHFAHRIRASARKGWVEVRDYTCREIESKNAFIMALRSAIVPNLTKIEQSCCKSRSLRALGGTGADPVWAYR